MRWRQEGVCVLDPDFLGRLNRNMFGKGTYFLVIHPIEILVFQFFLAEINSSKSNFKWLFMLSVHRRVRTSRQRTLLFAVRRTMSLSVKLTYHAIIKSDFLNTTTISAFKHEYQISSCILSPWMSYLFM